MWPDDVHWLPLLLANRPFVGRADFDTDASGKYTMLKWWFGVPSM
jgi:8-oxo-dGTP diphosphatase/2-hydroxy-dATP diphosphatase